MWLNVVGLAGRRKRPANVVGSRSGSRWQLAAEFVEVESGKRSDNRPRARAALAACKRHKAKLVIAKLDRLARNVAFIFGADGIGRRVHRGG